MYISDPHEVEAVFAFFREHLHKELEIATSAFEGLTHYEQMRVEKVDMASSHVVLLCKQSQRQLAIDPHHFSFATVSPDKRRLEIGRLLGGNITMRLIASEID